MPICSRCGQENPEIARFCLACGAPLQETPAPHEQRKTVTVLFCDVTGSTALGESTDPEALRALLARYFERMKGIVEAHGGTVEKFIGDAVMAVFGVPQVHEDDALRACRAGVEMRDALPELGLQARIGVNTGEVVTGTQERLATGDPVNVAARLEQAADPGEILLGEETLRLVRGAVETEPVEPLELKGKAEPASAHLLLGLQPDAPLFNRRGAGRLVGRERELEQLRQSFERAKQERTCHLFTILGTAGVGKSRLARELKTSIKDAALVVSGRCLSYGKGVTFSPVAEMLRSLPAPETILEGREDAHVIAEQLRALVGTSETVGGREETFWAVRRLFEALAEKKPLLAVFEDIQWAEPTMLDLVEHVADWSREAPILLLCLARLDLLDERPGWGGGKRNATSLLLEPLKKDETAELIDDLLSGQRLTAGLRGRIAEAAGGNPLFVEQMLAMLGDKPAAIGDFEVPPTIQALLAARLDSLDRAERAAIERAAVCGKEFDRASIEALSQDVDVGSALLQLVRKELLRLGGREDEFRFVHDLVRVAAYEAIPKRLRAHLHERFADGLERTRRGRLKEVEEILGFHLEQASRYLRELRVEDERATRLGLTASAYLESAGRRARGRADFPAAANLFERAAHLIPVHDPERIELLYRAAFNFEYFDPRLEEGAVARARAETSGFHNRRFDVYARLFDGRMAPSRGRPWSASAFLRFLETEALTSLTEIGDHGGLAVVWWEIANIRESAGQCAAAVEAWDAATIHASKSGDTFLSLQDILGPRTVTAWLGPAPVSEGLRQCEAALGAAAGRLDLEGAVLRNRAMLEAMRSEFHEARLQAARSAKIFDELGGGPRRSWRALGYVELLAGEFEAAEAWFRREVEGRREQPRYIVALTWEFLCRSVYQQGRYDEAFELSQRAERAAREELDEQLPWRGTRAKLLARQGRFDDAEGFVDHAIKMSEATDWLEWCADLEMDRAEVIRLAGRADDLEAVRRAWRLYEQKGHTVGARKAEALLADRREGPFRKVGE